MPPNEFVLFWQELSRALKLNEEGFFLSEYGAFTVVPVKNNEPFFEFTIRLLEVESRLLSEALMVSLFLNGQYFNIYKIPVWFSVENDKKRFLNIHFRVSGKNCLFSNLSVLFSGVSDFRKKAFGLIG